MRAKSTALSIVSAFLVLCVFAGNFKGGKKRTKKCRVSGTVVHMAAYCGGARMPDEFLNDLTKPKPFSTKKLYVMKGKINGFDAKPFLVFISDSLGHFSIVLPAGDYCIVDEFKRDKKYYDSILETYRIETENYSAVDPVCLKGWFEMPDAVFTVTKAGLKDLTIVYTDKCPWNSIPCVMYKGPLPP